MINMRGLTRIYMIVMKLIRLSEKPTGQIKAYKQDKTQQLKNYTGSHREPEKSGYIPWLPESGAPSTLSITDPVSQGLQQKRSF